MHFTLKKSIEILERTPQVLAVLLQRLSDGWTMHNEGGQTWSPYDIIGHFIHCEKTDWIPRTEIILSEKSDKTFEPFDRFAHFEMSNGKSLIQLLEEFTLLRQQSIQFLTSKQLTENELTDKGIHPAFGEVTLSQLLETWVVHDLNHLAQIARVMAFQYKSKVGPWSAYLGILQNRHKQ